ncbi:hypothetical protein B484DRAFT_482615, partial [Ochromonadaceae sp. CCMP2298]
MKCALVFLLAALLGSCLSSGKPQEGQNHDKSVFWMHIQKTSSWLGNFLLLWGCETVRGYARASEGRVVRYSVVARNITALRCEVPFYTGNFGFGYHVPLPDLRSLPHLNGSAVTLFRNPYDRVISSFMHGNGIHNIMFPIGFPNRASAKFTLRSQIRRSEFPIFTYASLPGIANCQTKMVLGRDCGRVADLSAEEVGEAVRRVRQDMRFVGLTEESDASAQLFVAMFPIPGVTGI